MPAHLLCRELEREKLQARLYVMPLLVAEADRETLRQEGRLLELEQKARERGYDPNGRGSGGGGLKSGARSVYNNEKNYIKSTFLL